MKFRINSLLALNRNQILIDPISTIHSKCPLKKYSPRIWYSKFFISFHRHLIHSWLQEKSQNLVFFRHTLYTNKGTNPHHLLSLVARAARCPEKNGKTQEQGRLRPLDPSPGLMIGFATISTSFFSLSLFSFPSFFLFFFFYVYIYIDRYALNVFHVLPMGLFTFCPVAGRAYIVQHRTLWSKESSTRDWIPLWSTCSF